MKPSELTPILATAIRNRFPILITGAPGVGKTDVITQAAAEADVDLIITHPAISDPTDYKGMPAIVGGAAEFLPFGDLRQIIEAKRPTVMFSDDIGQAPNSVQAAIMQLFLARRIGEHKVSEHVTFVGATNRRIDRAGVNGLLEPVKSRFMSIINLDVDLDDWCLWALRNGLPTSLVAFARWRPELLCNFKPTADLTNSASPRTVTNMGRWLLAGVNSYEVLAGAAGEGTATEYLTFEKIYKGLPNPDVIIMHPETSDVPTDAATLYALCGSLAARANAVNAPELFTYINRMPQEFQALLVKDAVVQSPEVASTRAFIEWTTANHSMNFGV